MYFIAFEQRQGVLVLACPEELDCNWTKPRRPSTDLSRDLHNRPLYVGLCEWQVLYFWISTHAWSLCDRFFICGSPPIPFLDLHPCMSRDLHNRPLYIGLCVTGSLFLDLHPYHFWISTHAWSLCDRFFISGSPPMHGLCVIGSLFLDLHPCMVSVWQVLYFWISAHACLVVEETHNTGNRTISTPASFSRTMQWSWNPISNVNNLSVDAKCRGTQATSWTCSTSGKTTLHARVGRLMNCLTWCVPYNSDRLTLA